MVHESRSISAAEFVCPRCGRTAKAEGTKRFLQCERCNVLMERMHTTLARESCENCGGTRFVQRVNLFIDTMLISSRHLYRMPYSLHEKSGLVSLPIDPGKIMAFERELAQPEKLTIPTCKFLDTRHVTRGEAAQLMIQAFDYQLKLESDEGQRAEPGRDYEPPEKAIPEVCFPPCIAKGLTGLKDGRKRFSFILINFLTSAGWERDAIEKMLLAWNAKNDELLREGMLTAQLTYHLRNKKRVLPPNCSNAAYYRDIGICLPDGLCKRIKNPVNYSVIKNRILAPQGKKRGAQHTSSQHK